MKKFVFILFGLISVTIGTVGVYVPGVPSTVFFLSGAYFFVRSNERLYRRFIQSHLYTEYVEKPFIRREVTPVKKFKIYLSLILVFVISILIVPHSWLKYLLTFILFLHLVGLTIFWHKNK